MKLSEIESRVREVLDDNASGKYTSREIGSRISDQSDAMFRKLTEINEKYHNKWVSLPGANARQVAADVWEYDIPRWVSKITQVRRAQESVTSRRKGVINNISDAPDETVVQGWDFSGLLTLRLHRFSKAEDLDVAVAKRPAKLTRGSLPTQSGLAANELRMDAPDSATAVDFPQETELDAYANSVVEIVSQNTGTHPVEGQIRVVTSSAPNQTVTGVSGNFTVLTLNRDWDEIPEESDAYETHAEIPDEHMRLLVLLVARSSFAQKGNTDEIRAIMDELHEQWAAFRMHFRPRQYQRPTVMKEDVVVASGDPLRRDPDRFPSW